MRRASLVCGSFVVSGCLLANPAYDSAGGTGGGFGTGSGATSLPGAPTTGDDPPSTDAPAQCRSDEACDDGLFCNGAEVCSPDRGCEPGPSPCAVDEICQEDKDVCATACDNDPDADGDGYPSVACMGGTDCDDQDPTIHPGATEVCAPDMIDEDCDPLTFGSLDADADGKVSSACCNVDGDGVARCGDDCDDQQPGYALGDWAHCGACGSACGVQQACIVGACGAARRVFITSTEYNANFGGLANADAACQERAAAAALGGTFKAYMVSSGEKIDRLMQPGPFVRLDGVILADDWNAFANSKGSIKAPFHVAETRAAIGDNVWTGYGEDFDLTCNDWTTAEGGCLSPGKPCGVAGESPQTDTRWNGNSLYNCSDMYRLYCVEQ